MSNTPFVTIIEASALSGISIWFWRKAVSQNLVPAFKSGNKVYINYEKAIEKINALCEEGISHD